MGRIWHEWLEKIVISSLNMKKIYVAVKKIAIMKINISVHPDCWFVSSDTII